MNVNVHTDSSVNKNCSGSNHRNCVASCIRLISYSRLDIMMMIIIIRVATIIAIYISLNIIIIKKRGRHVYN